MEDATHDDSRASDGDAVLRRRAKGSIVADVGDNLGRYVIEHCKSGRFELRLHGQPIGMFDTAESAKQRAQAGADTARAMASEDGS